MIDLNQKIKEFARKAYEIDTLAEYGNWKPNKTSEELLRSMHGVFIQFARLVAEDCAMIAYQTSDIDGECCANNILYQYDNDNFRSQK